MITWIITAGWIYWGVIFLFTCGFFITSVFEQRFRALFMSVLLFGGILIVFGAALTLEYSVRPWVILTILVLDGIALLFVTLPIGAKTPLLISGKQERIDERDAIFHRFYRLESGTQEFEEFYRNHPDKLKFDEKIRALPHLASGC